MRFSTHAYRVLSSSWPSNQELSSGGDQLNFVDSLLQAIPAGPTRVFVSLGHSLANNPPFLIHYSRCYSFVYSFFSFWIIEWAMDHLAYYFYYPDKPVNIHAPFCLIYLLLILIVKNN